LRGALALPGADINEFLGGYDSNWGAMIRTGGGLSSPTIPPLTTPMISAQTIITIAFD